MSIRNPAFVLALTLAALFALGGSATGQRSVQVPSAGPGPAQLDHVTVQKFGPRRAGRVLVLMPGTAGGAGDFTLLAKNMVRRMRGLQVWAIDRRSQPLEDTTVFEDALARKVSLREMFDYYLGWISNGGTPKDHFEFLDTSTTPYAKRWGMKTALTDARRVVMRAGRGNRDVLLGGHSLGASLAAAYAAWDFGGRPGFKDLDGIALIDGGLLGTFDGFGKRQAQVQLDSLDEQPFLDLLGIGIPEAAGLFAEAGGIYARRAPNASARQLQRYPLLPDDFKPPMEATYEAAFGYAFDRDTSPPALSLLHVNAGRLAASGSPRPWVNGGITPVGNLARVFGQEPANAVEWYFPRRLSIDTNGADRMRRNAVARLLGLRVWHTGRIDVPIYAFQTDLTDGGVLSGARRLIRRARTRGRESILVDGDPRFSHLDPLTVAGKPNRFTRTLRRFVRRTTDR